MKNLKLNDKKITFYTRNSIYRNSLQDGLQIKDLCCICFLSPLYMGKPVNSYFYNSEDTVCNGKKDLQTKETMLFKKI